MPPFSSSHFSELESRASSSLDHSSRGAFLEQLVGVQGKEFRRVLVEDPSLLLCAILKSTLGAWLGVSTSELGSLAVSEYGEIDGLPAGKRGGLHELGHLANGHAVFLEMLDMLKQAAQVIQFQGCSMFGCKEGTRAHHIMKNLALDFDDLIKRVEDQSATLIQRISTLAAVRSIYESQQSIEQNSKIGSVLISINHFGRVGI
jgi:hypothetical protein